MNQSLQELDKDIKIDKGWNHWKRQFELTADSESGFSFNVTIHQVSDRKIKKLCFF